MFIGRYYNLNQKYQKYLKLFYYANKIAIQIFAKTFIYLYFFIFQLYQIDKIDSLEILVLPKNYSQVYLIILFLFFQVYYVKYFEPFSFKEFNKIIKSIHSYEPSLDSKKWTSAYRFSINRDFKIKYIFFIFFFCVIPQLLNQCYLYSIEPRGALTVAED